MIVSDNCSEFTSNAILQWTDRTKVEWHYIAPGKPIQNAFIESLMVGCEMSSWMKRSSRR